MRAVGKGYSRQKNSKSLIKTKLLEKHFLKTVIANNHDKIINKLVAETACEDACEELRADSTCYKRCFEVSSDGTW